MLNSRPPRCHKPLSDKSLFFCMMMAILALAANPLCAQTAGHVNAVVIQGASVFDSNTGAMLADRTIVIEGERIRSIGTDQEIQIPTNATVIDAHGKFVIPGL